MRSGDTIAAISSAVGPAGRMIVRLSGEDARRIAAELGSRLTAAPGSFTRDTVTFAGLSFCAWIYFFRSPRSYTGEDLLELHIPGNPLLARMLLDELIAHGARPAEAGEFTARAYFNGRIDLTEAEGVAATIAAQNEQELTAARQLLSGELARRLAPAMDRLTETLALIEVGIDFSDEDVTFLSPEQIERNLIDASCSLSDLVEQSARFERLTHEPQVVLAGRPNAGKSALLNALAGHERAVVSPLAGTTRDLLSAEVALSRGIIRLADAAGVDEQELPDDADASPAAGIARQMHRRALHAVESADLVVLVRDIVDPEPPLVLPREPDLVVVNKIDMLSYPVHPNESNTSISVSAATGAGLDALRQRLDTLAFGQTSAGSALALNARHLRAIEEAQAALARARRHVADRAGEELVALELREALDALGRILGRATPDDLLGRIFSTFCIGK